MSSRKDDTALIRGTIVTHTWQDLITDVAGSYHGHGTILSQTWHDLITDVTVRL